MREIMPVIRLLVCYFEVYMYLDFMRSIFTRRNYKKELSILIVVGVPLVIFGINELGSRVNILVVPLIYIGLALVIFQDGWKKCTLYSCLFYLILVGLEFGCMVLFHLTEQTGHGRGNEIEFTVMIVLQKTLTFIVFKILQHKSGRYGNPEVNHFFWKILLFPFSTMLVYAGIFYSGFYIRATGVIQGLLTVGCILLLLSNVLVFYLFQQLAEVMEKQNKMEQNALKMELREHHYNQIEKIIQRYGAYAHDLKHYLNVIGNLAYGAENEEIIHILEDMQITVEKIPSTYYCKNHIVNAMLNDLLEELRKDDIENRIFVERNIDLDFVDDGDFITMLGNMFENALDAVRQCETKRIEVETYASDNNKFIVIRVTNTYQVRPVHTGDRLITTKQNRDKHGYGVQQIRNTAEKYGGFYLLDFNENICEAQLFLSRKRF